MARHRLTLRKGSNFDLLWRGWRRKGRGKAPKRFGLVRAGKFRVACCSCGWESAHFKGMTAVEDAVHAWESHRDGGRADARGSVRRADSGAVRRPRVVGGSD
jgi:hypothetical protein